MKIINLPEGRFALVDDENFEYLNQFKWIAVKKGTTYYALRSDKKRKILMHLEIMKKNPGLEIDHKDGDGLNNQKENMRYCTHAQNMMNKKKVSHKTSSKFKGVSFAKHVNRWVVSIRINRKRIHGGYFDIEIEAALKYNQMATEYFGDFARLNKVESNLLLST